MHRGACHKSRRGASNNQATQAQTCNILQFFLSSGVVMRRHVAPSTVAIKLARGPSLFARTTQEASVSWAPLGSRNLRFCVSPPCDRAGVARPRRPLTRSRAGEWEPRRAQAAAKNIPWGQAGCLRLGLDQILGITIASTAYISHTVAATPATRRFL